jgi:hypothetical protein
MAKEKTREMRRRRHRRQEALKLRAKTAAAQAPKK